MRPEMPADRCPGVLRPHQAVDGALLRLRTPGGQLTGESLARLAKLADEFSTGEVHLTSRANLQLRGVRVDTAGDVPSTLVEAVTAAGLLPSPSHERVRNIVASPLSGLVGGRGDVRPVVRELDGFLCADPLLARLPGRFLFVLDDGRGDVAGLRGDLTFRLTGPDHGRLVLGQRLATSAVPVAEAAKHLARLAVSFIRVRTSEWHVADLPMGGRELSLDGFIEVDAVAEQGNGHGEPMPLGLLPQDDGRCAISVAVPLGTLTQEQIGSLAAAAARGTGRLVVTPWRGVVVPDLDASHAAVVAGELTANGLVADPASPWTRITACAGAPGCGSAHGDTRYAAREIAHRSATREADPSTLPVHVVACERRCGAPSSPHLLVFARSS
jgi:precorrin-3B synthase